MDPTSLKVHACNEALALAKDLPVRHSVICSDCLEVITNINRGAATTYVPVLRETDHTRREFDDAIFRF